MGSRLSIIYDKPTYEHDCDECVFVGGYYDPELEKDGYPKLVDLYYHRRDNPFGSDIITRFGNGGGDYACMRFFTYVSIFRSGFELKRDYHPSYRALWACMEKLMDEWPCALQH